MGQIRAKGGAGRFLPWPVGLIATADGWAEVQAEAAAKGKRQREEGASGDGAAAARRPPTIMGAILKQRFNHEEVQQVATNTKVAKAMEAAAAVLGAGSCPQLLTYIVKETAPFAASLQKTFPAVTSRRKGDGGEGKKGGTDGRAWNQLGERKCTPKILNGLPRLEQLQRLEEEQAAQGDEGARRAAAIRQVNWTLWQAKVITQEQYTKKPVIKSLAAFIRTYTGLEQPWRKYLQRHGVEGGSTIAWKYYFDFVHGDHHKHDTLMEGHAVVPLVLDDTKAGAAPAPSASQSAGCGRPAGRAGGSVGDLIVDYLNYVYIFLYRGNWCCEFELLGLGSDRPCH